MMKPVESVIAAHIACVGFRMQEWKTRFRMYPSRTINNSPEIVAVNYAGFAHIPKNMWLNSYLTKKELMKNRPVLLLTVLLFISCGEKTPESDPAENEILKTGIVQERQEKDIGFKTGGKDSPIPAEDLPGFTGLSYFPVELKYRLQLAMKTFDKPDVFKIITSRGVERDTERTGFFEFELDGTVCKLFAYKLLDIQEKYPGHIFIPFRDATSGNETYGGGRYIDLQENDTGYYVVDFNEAYNPLCAYGKTTYNCPIPPAENTLPVAIYAGEKGYSKSH